MLTEIRRDIKMFKSMRDLDTFINVMQGAEKSWANIEDLNFAVAIASQNRFLQMGAAIFLSTAPKELSQKERVGVVLFTGFVTLVDQELDDKTCPIFTNSDDLTNYLFSRKAKVERTDLTLRELYDLTIAHFPDAKQQELAKFSKEMADVHVCIGNHGVAGEYGFKEAEEYKRRTNEAYARTGLCLAENTSIDMADLPKASFAIQMIDDAADWQEDIINNKQNLFVGMARDVWKEKGCLVETDLDLMFSKMKNGGVVRARDFLRLSGMKNTKLAYGKIFQSELSKLRNSRYKFFLAIEGKVLLGLKSLF